MKNNTQIQRYDQRDALVYRSQLMPGTKEYDVYYNLHPELKTLDDKARIHFSESLSNKVRLQQFPDERFAAAWVYGTKKSTVYLLKDAIDGPVNTDRLPLDSPVETSKKIKGFAKYLGAGLVGIARLDQAWVYTHKGQQDSGEWGQPINLTHKFAIVMGFPQDWDLWLTCAQASIPGHLDEWSHYHKMSDVAIRLASAIRDMGYPARAQIQSNYTCILPPLAVDAGLGEQCLIGLCLTKEYGLAYRLCAVTTDLPLAPDPLSKLGIEDFCTRCNKCVEACPSGALSKKEKIEINGRRVWKQNVSQCFKYWNAKGVSCSICRRACPWSKPRSLPHTLVANLSQSIPLLRPLILKADDIIYGKIPRNYPPPKWMQYTAQQMSLRRRLEYWFDKL